MIVMECPTDIKGPAHLYYVGDVHQHDFKNFDLKVEVMTSPKANSGIYFHTKYQASGWPRFGLECQVNNSHSDWRRTGSLYGVKELTWGPEKPPAKNPEDTTTFAHAPLTDNVWYTQEVIYVNGQVTVKFDGKTRLEYKIPDADHEHKLAYMIWQPHGTICLQGHPPMPGQISKACFKNIVIKVLPD